MNLPLDYKPLSCDAIRSLESLGGSLLDETLKACYWQGDYVTVENAIDTGAFGGRYPAGSKEHDRLCEFLFRNHADRDLGNKLTFKILARLKDDPDEMARLLMHGLGRQNNFGELVHLLIIEGADLHRPVRPIGKDKVGREHDVAILSPAQTYMSSLIGSEVGAFPYLLAERLDTIPLAISGMDGDETATKNLMLSALDMGRNAIAELLFARLDKTTPAVQQELDYMLESAHDRGDTEVALKLLALGHTPAERRLWERLCTEDRDRYPGDGSFAHMMLRYSGNDGLTMQDGRHMVDVALGALLENGLDPSWAVHDSLLNLAYRHQNKTAFAMLLEAGADAAEVNNYPAVDETHRELISMAQAMSARRAIEGILTNARQRSFPEGRA